MNSSKRYLVTGGAGFIGSNLVDALIKDGHKVLVIDDLSTGKKENLSPRAEFYQKDIRQLSDIESLFVGVDGVFHLAAVPSVQISIDQPAETHSVNVDGTFNVLMASYKAKVKRFIQSSSCSIYGDSVVFPQREDLPVRPKSPYALHKYINEEYCRIFSTIYGLETINLRYFNVYGPRMPYSGPYSGVIRVFLKQKKANEPLTITGDGEQSRDYVFVGDVVRANMLAMESDRVGAGEIINIGSGQSCTVNQIADMVGGPKKYLPPRIEPRRALADNSLAKKLLDWEPTVSLEEGMAKII
ncbi:MAG: NAD-dependent epimerase/dehydratase family protein [bacterium]|nr:NAD-dependent epimerase/dehydratase family protein [bacterium]